MGFPFNEQLPNVGRVGQDYSFTMANTTYKSNSSGEITYQVSDLPSWLSFDSGSRTFTGKPSDSDVGQFDITIVGTDQSDQSTLSNKYTMIVSNDTGIHVNSSNSVIQQLAQFGHTNGNDGLVVKPGDKINLKFTKDTFEEYSSSQRSIIAYYGRSADRSSLPNWIYFDGEELTFSGTVPYVTSENAPSFEYGFSFIASDYYGYAGASSVFKLVVGGHQLETDLNSTIKINGTFGQNVDEIVPIMSHVYLDDKLISKDNISEVDADDLPSYLSFNDEDYAITGNFPNTSTFDNFSITVKDTYGNTVELPYSFNAIGSVFTVNSLDDVNATKGEWFSYQIMNSIFTNVNDTEVTVDYDNANWLSYHDDNRTLNGMTPKDLKELKITIEGKLDSEDEEKSFNIRGVNKEVTSSTSSSSSTATSSSSGTAAATASTTDDSSSATSGAAHHSNKNRDLAIGLGVGIPVFVILVAAIVLFCCCYKRRKNRKESDDEKGAMSSGQTAGAAAAAGVTGAAATAAGAATFPIDPKNESQVNLMKLEGLSANSSSSSLTHVDTNESFYDTHNDQFPVSKSWRANTDSDDKAVAATSANLNRNSDASLSTVNTEQLFSVRLVDDNAQRDSERSSANNAFMSSNSLNAMLQRDNSSQNIHRLDSDGNIVEYNTLAPTSSPERMPHRLPNSSSQLDIVPEENSRDMSNREDTTGSISNLLHKFDQSPSSESSLSSDDLEMGSSSPKPHTHRTDSPTYLFEFNNGELPSSESDKFHIHDTQINNNVPINNLSPTLSPSAGSTPTSPARQRHLLSSNSNPHHSILTLDSLSSEKFIYDGKLRPADSLSPVKNLCSRTSSGSLISGGRNSGSGRENGAATLVDFTRKASLRDSSYEPDYTHHEESASVHQNDSD
ncbi:AXL2 [Candida metapsilosis]|uniref:AXL2 n=1 Tax=Candida metapsilosis TaxID=273372 RepID=A0A8H8DB01_9ASCO|nr:AXL2 [Candida metapsilosis]